VSKERKRDRERDLQYRELQATIRSQEALIRTLREKETSLQLIYDLAPINIYRKDSAGGFIAVNREFEKTFGITDESIRGKSNAAYLEPDLQGMANAHDREVLNTGKHVEQEETIGSRVFRIIKHPVFDEAGNPIEIMGFDIDVTELKEAQKALEHQNHDLERLNVELEKRVYDRTAELEAANRALQKSEDLLKKSQAIAHVGSWELDLTTNRLTWSDEVYHMFGLHPDEFDVTRWGFRDTIIHPDDRAALDAAYKESIRDEEDSYETEHRIIRQDTGEIRVVHEKCEHIRNSSGRIVSSVGMVADITDRRLAEEELQKRQRLESLGILAGGIAHDFNNLLLGIFANLEMAKLHIDGSNPAGEFLDGALSAFARTKALTQQLLTFSKGGTPRKTAVSLDSLLKESAQLALSGSNVRAMFELDQNLSLVNADESQLSQILNNVLINSRQAMPDGGEVRIEAHNAVLDQSSALPLAPGTYVQLAITDQGAGIPLDILPNIFDPFFTTKEGGSGLGLATCFSIVARHGGHIFAETTMGSGTVITVLLPASASAEAEQSVEIVKDDTAIATGRILLMDDEPQLLSITSRMLETLGFAVETAKSGEDALQLYADRLAQGSRFDAVILDLTIPGGMGGEELVPRLLTMDPRVKAIATSGYVGSGILANPKEFGFVAVISKPYRLELLRQVLAGVLASDLPK
jgi:PAS domain S-box-containing protein